MLQVAFYKGPPARIVHRITHALISWWTESPYSHCEIVLGGVGYSSSARDGGVRAAPIDVMSGRWDVIAVDAHPALVLEVYRRTCGARYDWWGALRHAVPWLRQRGARWYCSEWCAAALGMECVQMTPARLYRRLIGREARLDLR